MLLGTTRSCLSCIATWIAATRRGRTWRRSKGTSRRLSTGETRPEKKSFSWDFDPQHGDELWNHWQSFPLRVKTNLLRYSSHKVSSILMFSTCQLNYFPSRYADIYAASVLNMLYYPTFYMFRGELHSVWLRVFGERAVTLFYISSNNILSFIYFIYLFFLLIFYLFLYLSIFIFFYIQLHT